MEKIISPLESPTTFDKILKVTSVPFLITDIDLLSCELDGFTFKVLYWVILNWYYVKTKQNYNTLTVPCEKSKMVSFASSVMKTVDLVGN